MPLETSKSNCLPWFPKLSQKYFHRGLQSLHWRFTDYSSKRWFTKKLFSHIHWYKHKPTHAHTHTHTRARRRKKSFGKMSFQRTVQIPKKAKSLVSDLTLLILLQIVFTKKRFLDTAFMTTTLCTNSVLFTSLTVSHCGQKLWTKLRIVISEINTEWHEKLTLRCRALNGLFGQIEDIFIQFYRLKTSWELQSYGNFNVLKLCWLRNVSELSPILKISRNNNPLNLAGCLHAPVGHLFNFLGKIWIAAKNFEQFLGIARVSATE